MKRHPGTRPLIAVLRLETHWCVDGRLRSRGSFPSFLAALARQASVLALLPVVDGQTEPCGEQDVAAEVSSLHGLVRLPRCEGYLRAYLAIPRVLAALVRARRQTRLLLVRVPEHLNLVVLPLATLLGFRTCCWLVADRETILSAEMQRRGLSFGTFAGAVLNRLTGAVERRFLRRHPVIANGRALFDKACDGTGRRSDVLQVQSTTLPADLPARPAVGARNAVLDLLYVGRFAPEKGVGDLLQAVGLLRRNLPLGPFADLRLRLVGWHAHGEEERLLGEIRSLGIADCVEIVGPLPFGEKLFAQYLEADAFVLPSWIEGTPRVLVEAMAFGLPVVATRVGGIPDLVTHGVDGLLVPARSPGQLAAALRLLASDDATRAALADRARERASGQTVDSLARTIAGFVARQEPGIDA